MLGSGAVLLHPYNPSRAPHGGGRVSVDEAGRIRRLGIVKSGVIGGFARRVTPHPGVEIFTKDAEPPPSNAECRQLPRTNRAAQRTRRKAIVARGLCEGQDWSGRVGLRHARRIARLGAIKKPQSGEGARFTFFRCRVACHVGAQFRRAPLDSRARSGQESPSERAGRSRALEAPSSPGVD